MDSNRYPGRAAVKDGAIILPAAAPTLWGMTPETRLRRQLDRLPQPSGGLILRGDVVYEGSVLQGLINRSGIALTDADGTRLAIHTTAPGADAENWMAQGGDLPPGLDTVTPDDIGATYNKQLRKRSEPKCYVLTPANVRAVEWDLYKASYKGITDLVTKYVWPVPAFHATRLCARLKLSPNMVTGIGAVLMLAALVLFAQGQYGWGLLAGWIMTFLDTVDGKLARVTLTSSRWGNVFDHGIDLIHPPFWYVAWGMGLAAAGFPGLPWVRAGLWAMFVCYIAGRLCEGYFMRRFGFHVHVWRRFDSMFRLVVARRNPNMILLTLCWLAGRPDIGLLLVVLWTVASVPVHLAQIAQAEATRRRGGAIESWLSR